MIGTAYEVNCKNVLWIDGPCNWILFERFYKLVKGIDDAVTSIFDLVTYRTVDEEKHMNFEAGNTKGILSVSGDGS